MYADVVSTDALNYKHLEQSLEQNLAYSVAMGEHSHTHAHHLNLFIIVS